MSDRSDANSLAREASHLNNQSITFRSSGRLMEAEAKARESVDLYRTLNRETGTHSPDLAAAINNLGVKLFDLGRFGEALEATEEAVAIRRELAVVERVRYAPDLAASLSNIGGILSRLGRFGEALEATEEAVAIRRELAAVE
ncbi:tetratricopeptide repeat protein, partial [Saccharopolyspora sp. K220]|uniref:tetratricopeptide repeat protein n=1 Tax=Saccharopolyspora soli TaxID=2926618 RepID=UPI001F57AB71